MTIVHYKSKLQILFEFFIFLLLFFKVGVWSLQSRYISASWHKHPVFLTTTPVHVIITNTAPPQQHNNTTTSVHIKHNTSQKWNLCQTHSFQMALSPQSGFKLNWSFCRLTGSTSHNLKWVTLKIANFRSKTTTFFFANFHFLSDREHFG